MEIITPAAKDDIPQLVSLLHVLFSQEAEFKPDAVRQAAGLKAIIESPQTGVILVARSGKTISGMVSLLFTISTVEGGPVCWLEDMIVQPGLRGEGTGSRLLSAAIEYARLNEFRRITLLTDSDNAGAQRLYQRSGFAPSRMSVLRLQL